MPEFGPRGYYFEDFEIDMEFTSSARTITESDIVSFAGLSGDYNQIHTDEEFSKSTPFGQRIAHGLLITSIASGLVAQSGLLEGTVIAFREIDQWKFTKPVFIGDTIHVVMKVVEKKIYKRLGGGTIRIYVDVLNQNDETVIKGIWIALMASKPE
jgi:acyl dehydratase